jgi:FKBP-type peptidyl-prolyl cis-trans isomerase
LSEEEQRQSSSLYSIYVTFQQQSKMTKFFVLIGFLAIVGSAAGFTMSMSAPSSAPTSSRRSFVRNAGTAGAAVAIFHPRSAGAVLADPTTEVDLSTFTTSDSGLQYKVVKEGTGAVPANGQTVKAHYTGWLDGFDSIRKFDSSRDRGRPFNFAVGKGQVIRGWDETFSEMKVGERRQIILPARLAYGDRGAGGLIPGGATLYFDVELLGIL